MYAALALPLLAGCKVDAALSVRVRDEGSGVVRATVRLDRTARALLAPPGTDPRDRLRLDDLRAAGWRIRWTVRGDRGPVTVRLAKPFTRPADAGRVVAELTGPSGLLRDVTVTRDGGPLRTGWSFAARTGARPAVGLAADPELVAALPARGGDAGVTERWLTDRLQRALRAHLVVDLPAGAPRRWPLGDGTARTVALATSRVRVGRVLTLGAGVAAGSVALGVGIAGEARRRRRVAAGPRRGSGSGRPVTG